MTQSRKESFIKYVKLQVHDDGDIELTSVKGEKDQKFHEEFIGTAQFFDISRKEKLINTIMDLGIGRREAETAVAKQFNADYGESEII